MNLSNFKIVNQPSVSPCISGGRNYKLDNEVKFTWGDEQITILRGYIFDGASVPRILHWFIGPMDPRVVASALIHDAIYTNPDLVGVGVYMKGGVQVDRIFTKKEADLFFKAANKANNMDAVRTTLAYWAVRMFGRGDFKKFAASEKVQPTF